MVTDIHNFCFPLLFCFYVPLLILYWSRSDSSSEKLRILRIRANIFRHNLWEWSGCMGDGNLSPLAGTRQHRSTMPLCPSTSTSPWSMGIWSDPLTSNAQCRKKCHWCFYILSFMWIYSYFIEEYKDILRSSYWIEVSITLCDNLWQAPEHEFVEAFTKWRIYTVPDFCWVETNRSFNCDIVYKGCSWTYSSIYPTNTLLDSCQDNINSFLTCPW